MLAERSGSTLALNRLVERDRESLDRQTHRTLLSAVLSHDETAAEMEVRARHWEYPLKGRHLLAVVLPPRVDDDCAAAGALARSGRSACTVRGRGVGHSWSSCVRPHRGHR